MTTDRSFKLFIQKYSGNASNGNSRDVVWSERAFSEEKRPPKDK